MCHANPSERSRFIRCIYNLLNSSSNAVRYEAAGTLITLSNAPTAIKAAASCYIELIIKESDNNVKLIVLDRLIAIKENENTERVMQDLVMDILRVLAAPDIEVRRKTLNLAMDLVSSRNIEEMVLVLKKEVSKTHNVEHEDTGKYRQLLVRTLHSCCIRVCIRCVIIIFSIELISQYFVCSFPMWQPPLYPYCRNFYPIQTNRPPPMCLSSFARQYKNSRICVR